MRTVSIMVYFCINHFISKGAMENYFIISQLQKDWNSANKSCEQCGGTLVRLKDLQTIDDSSYNTRIKLENASPFWSSVTGLFTPWIVYKGCYPQPPLDTYNVSLGFNSVGNCFWHCRSHLSTEPNFIALGDKMCFCINGKLDLQLAESNKCNITCNNNSSEDGFCGGNGHISLYRDFKYRNIGDGFCLAYNCKFGQPYLSGYDCDEEYEGFCADILNDVHIQPSLTWNGYSKACKAQNQFLTAFIEPSNHKFSCSSPTWTGIRSYKIDIDKEEKGCYQIKRILGVWLYQKVNCETKLSFVCVISGSFQRFSMAFTQCLHLMSNVTNNITPSVFTRSSQRVESKGAASSHPVVNVTDSNSSYAVARSSKAKSESAIIGPVAGSVTGIIILITIVLTFYFVRKKRQSKNHRAPPVENMIYGVSNLDRVENIENRYVHVIANSANEKKQLRTTDTDKVYIENTEGEYDHLRSPRFKLDKTADESHYDRSESAYTLTTREGHCDKVYGSHYNYIDSSEENPYDSKSNDFNKGYESDYSSLAENTCGLKSRECTSPEKVYYNTTFGE